MSKYEYTIMMADKVIDTRKSNREYEYAIAALRGPKWRASRIKELELQIKKCSANLGSPTCSAADKQMYEKMIIEMGVRHVQMQGWADDWYVVGYCGNRTLAQKAHAKESKFVGDWGWDDVVILGVNKREIKKRV